MHLYMATRGQKHLVDTFTNMLQGVMLPYQASPHAPKGLLQMGVRPLQLWELAFPKEHLHAVLTSLDGSKFKESDDRPMAKLFRKFVWLANNRFSGLQPVPEKWDTAKKFVIPNRDPAIDIKYLAIKEDADGKVELV